MTAQDIRALLNVSPFAPVKLSTLDGNSYVVPHPDFLTFSPTGRTCLVYADDGETYTILDVLTITGAVPVKGGEQKK